MKSMSNSNGASQQNSSIGFRKDLFSELAQLEPSNFWFKARNKLILWAMKKYSHRPKNFLEIGCGTGFVLSAIATNYPKTELHGSEIFEEGLKYAGKRVKNAHLKKMDARNIPFANEFDVIGAFDVLEHIVEDTQVIEQVNHALIPNGKFLVTVPQHKWLWSQVDERACHVRRYTAKEIENKLIDANFTILRSTSFVSILLPAMFISRALKKKKEVSMPDPKAELKIHPSLNFIFYQILKLEIYLIKSGMNFSIGGSRLIVAQKN